MVKFSYNLPSGDYNIVLNKEELEELSERGHLKFRPLRSECSVNRFSYNNEKRHGNRNSIYHDSRTIKRRNLL